MQQKDGMFLHLELRIHFYTIHYVYHDFSRLNSGFPFFQMNIFTLTQTVCTAPLILK